ncbi:MAG: CsbD family protein [Terracidiphilus sp.]
MNSDDIKGTIDDATGRAKRQVGEWTGDTKTQADGAAQQVKGKIEKAVGSVRDAVSNPDRPVERDNDMDDNVDRESVRDRK